MACGKWRACATRCGARQARQRGSAGSAPLTRKILIFPTSFFSNWCAVWGGAGACIVHCACVLSECVRACVCARACVLWALCVCARALRRRREAPTRHEDVTAHLVDLLELLGPLLVVLLELALPQPRTCTHIHAVHIQGAHIERRRWEGVRAAGGRVCRPRSAHDAAGRARWTGPYLLGDAASELLHLLHRVHFHLLPLRDHGRRAGRVGGA